MKRVLYLCGMVLLSAGVASAAPITYDAVLSGPAENPPNTSPGTGLAIITIDTATNELDVAVDFAGLTSPTTASHIHCCIAPPGATGVATTIPTFPDFPLGVMSGSYVHSFNMLDLSTWNPAFVMANGNTAAGAEAALVAGLAAGEAYLNIHTMAHPGGEIRGFLPPPLEPTSLLPPGTGLVAAAARRLSKRRS